MLVIFGLVAGLRAEEITLLRPKKPTGTTRVLHFPQDQSVGVVYLQDENLVIPETVKGFH